MKCCPLKWLQLDDVYEGIERLTSMAKYRILVLLKFLAQRFLGTCVFLTQHEFLLAIEDMTLTMSSLW